MGKHLTTDSELEVTLGLLRAVHNDQSLTQRSAAQELGVALGLVNTYLKRCVKKGLVKVRQAPNKRYAYYLTPKGFAEKSRLAAEFLSQSLNLFRQAQNDYTVLLSECAEQGWESIALFGASDLAEILTLYAREYPVRIVGVIDDAFDEATFAGMPVVASIADLAAPIDACVITDLKTPQASYDFLVSAFPTARVLAPSLLELRTATASEEVAS